MAGVVVVELKSVEQVRPLHKKQLLTYLRPADKPLGLLINFNEVLLKDGITRIINLWRIFLLEKLCAPCGLCERKKSSSHRALGAHRGFFDRNRGRLL